MRLWQDALIAMPAVIGLASILWFFVRWLFFVPVTTHRTLVLIYARGDGDGLEQQMRALTMLRRERGAIGEILLVDCGLSEQGRHLCYLLAREDHGITMCHSDEITKFII